MLKGTDVAPLHIAWRKGHVDAARLVGARGCVRSGTTAAPSVKATRSRPGIEAGIITPEKSAATAARASTTSLTTTETDHGCLDNGAEVIRRLPRSPLDIAQENGHAAVVASSRSIRSDRGDGAEGESTRLTSFNRDRETMIMTR